jgi:hypothetical protein
MRSEWGAVAALSFVKADGRQVIFTFKRSCPCVSARFRLKTGLDPQAGKAVSSSEFIKTTEEIIVFWVVVMRGIPVAISP